MNVVGKVGSFITQGVYSVATPFHPFGGAVDIIVVQQQDGSFRSTPWYVQFGKFQGVLKGAEKMVRINVNGVEADFHMFLDNSGEAYFVREADSCQDGVELRVPTNEMEGVLDHSLSIDNSQCNINTGNVENYRLQSTFSDPGILRDDFSSFRPDHLESTDSDLCRFYDFQDDQSFDGELSPEYGSGRYDNMDVVENFVEAQSSDSEVVLVSVDGHILTAPISSNKFTSVASCENNNIRAHESLSEKCEDEGHAHQIQVGDDLNESETLHCEGTCDMHAADSYKEVDESALKTSMLNNCQQDRHDDWQGEDDRDMLNNDPIKEYGKPVSEDNGIRSIHLNEQGEEGKENTHLDNDNVCIKNQDVDLYVYSDAEDVSPSVKNDKYKSCLDLTTAAENEISEGKEAISPEEKLVQNFEASNFTDLGISEISCLDVEMVTDTNISSTAEPTVHAYVDSSPAATDSLAEPSVGTLSNPLSERSKRSSVECIDSECMPTGNTSLYKDEQASLNLSDGAAKSNVEGVFATTESDRSNVLHPQSSSLSEEGQSHSSPMLEISLCRHLLHPGMGLDAANEAFNSHRISVEEYKISAVSAVKNENLVVRYKEKYLPWDRAASIVLGIAAFGLDLSIESKDVIPVEQEVTLKPGENNSGSASGRRWRLWSIPFRRVKSVQHSNSSSSEEVFVDPESVMPNPLTHLAPTSQSGTPRSATSLKPPPKKILRTNIPTNEQIESLNLKEGQNDVTFSFSTRVLGVQQVEAHIYLWKWNARIVISDVDGTITKSDVLGQFMPLVGKDWSQSGVACLFTAIKENGYQLLFLSARAIVQAYLTKSFLFNLKQDGKTLPNGPVVISPNGLFPSLFREVIRRAPHEFKIACLEDIKALFPADYNPFYAGFGNRDTDELTYRKIGIPKGKIFIINPKGEVAINHRVDVKSYTSLHTLVHDMFPPTSMAEQEDYNHWNYWKTPLPDIDD